MKYRNMFLKYMAPAGDDGAADGGAAGDNGQEGKKQEDPPSGESEHKPSDKEAQLLKEVMTKKAALKQMEEKFKDIDPELYRVMLQERQQLQEQTQAEADRQEQERLKAEGKFDELLQAQARQADSRVEQVKAQYQKELSEATAELEGLKAQLEGQQTLINSLTIDSAFANSQFIREELLPAFNPAKTKKLYGEHFDVVEGKVVAFDKPRGATDRAQLVNKDGNPLAFEEAISRLVESDPDADAMKRSKHKEGAGSFSTSQTAAQKPPVIQPGVSRITAALNAKK